MVAAAADLAPLERSLSSGFERLTGVRPTFTFGSTGMLARQIENGAPFDLYLAADEGYVDRLLAGGYVSSKRIYAIGRIVLWSRESRYRSVEMLKSDEIRHIAIANPAHAPYGKAAREALEKLGLWQRVERRIVYGENVRQAFEMARSGNADITIVAATLGGPGAILLPAKLHQPIRQAGAVVRTTSAAALATRFLEYLLSPAGAAILVSGGLEAPRSVPTAPAR